MFGFRCLYDFDGLLILGFIMNLHLSRDSLCRWAAVFFIIIIAYYFIYLHSLIISFFFLVFMLFHPSSFSSSVSVNISWFFFYLVFIIIVGIITIRTVMWVDFFSSLSLSSSFSQIILQDTEGWLNRWREGSSGRSFRRWSIATTETSFTETSR